MVRLQIVNDKRMIGPENRPRPAERHSRDSENGTKVKEGVRLQDVRIRTSWIAKIKVIQGELSHERDRLAGLVEQKSEFASGWRGTLACLSLATP